MCDFYVTLHGRSFASLDSWNFNYLESVNIPQLAVVIEKYGENNQELVRPLFDELVSRGYLRKLEWGFCLSSEGLTFGTIPAWKKALNYLNDNRGLGIILSLIALTVSIIALWNSSR